MVNDEGSRTGVLGNNTINLDMEYAARKANLKFILNVVLNEDKEVVAAYAGDSVDAHRHGCAEEMKHISLQRKKGNVVISSAGGYPLDQNLQQLVKAINTADYCCNDNGVIIAVAGCRNGIGGIHFERQLSEEGTPATILKRFSKIDPRETENDQWQSQMLLNVLKSKRIIVCTDGIPKERIEKMKMLHSANIQGAIDLARKLVEDPEYVIIPDGIGVIIVQPVRRFYYPEKRYCDEIVVAPDSFKGSLCASTVAESMARGFERVIPGAQVFRLPIGDGGEGTAESIRISLDGEKVDVLTVDSLGRNVLGHIIMIDGGKTAVIEMAVASGLTLISEEERNPMFTSTYGTGLLIRDALDRCVKKIILAIGGSATNDGGMGMATALGAVFRDKAGSVLLGKGEELSQVETIDLKKVDSRLHDTEIQILCDVDSPFYGPRGAACLYSRQKGANEEQIEELDRGLKRFAQVIERDLGKR